MKRFIFLILTVLAAVQRIESSPIPDTLDIVNINLNIEEEPKTNNEAGNQADYSAGNESGWNMPGGAGSEAEECCGFFNCCEPDM